MKLIVVLGESCSGKTTLCRKLLNEIPNSNMINMERVHGGITYDAYKIAQIKKNWFIKLFSKPIIFFDILLRTHTKIIPTLKTKHVICDRYDDMDGIWKKMLVFLTPRPDITYVLHRKFNRPED